MGIKDTSFYGQKMIEEAVVPTAPRTGKAGSADESAAKGGRRGEDSPKGSVAPKTALPLCGVAPGVKKRRVGLPSLHLASLFDTFLTVWCALQGASFPVS